MELKRTREKTHEEHSPTSTKIPRQGSQSPSKSTSLQKSPMSPVKTSPVPSTPSVSSIKIPESPAPKSGLASPTLGNKGLKPSGLGEFGGNDRTIFGVSLDQPGTLSSMVESNQSTTFGSTVSTSFGKIAEQSQSFADMLKQQQASGPKSFSDMLKQQTPDQAPKSFADLLKEQSEEKPSFASMLKSHKKNDEEEEVCVEEEPEEEFGDRPLPVPLETIATGEEDETNLFTSNCRLYHLNDQQQWKERGIGNLHLNQGKDFRRLVMRLEGVHRLILNVRVVKKMPCVRVQEKYIRFVATEAPPKPTTFLLKFSSVDKAMSLEQLLTK